MINKILRQLIVLLLVFIPFIDIFADNIEKPVLKTVVIDPGHGGKDPGCVSRDKRTYEKTVTLELAKLLGAKIKATYPDVNVIYTRTTDKYLTLNERANIANKNKANLFLSIHINSFSSSRPQGFSAHILGKSRDKNRDLFGSNMDLVRRENSVILLEEDHGTKYQGFDPSDPESFIFFNLMQNAFYEHSIQFAFELEKELKKGPFKISRGVTQEPFLVLWKTTMPAVLVETGFISNNDDLKQLRSSTGKETIASSLFRAFVNFKKSYDGSTDYVAVKADSKPIIKEEITTKFFGTQIFVLSNKLNPKDEIFKGHEPMIIPVGKMYKYIIGASESIETAKSEFSKIRGAFKGSYLVEVDNNNVRVYKNEN